MSLQAKLDAFKADFEAGNPPYRRSPFRDRGHAPRDRRAEGQRCGRARQEGRGQGAGLHPQGSRGQGRFLAGPAGEGTADRQLLPRRLVPLLQHGAAGAPGGTSGIREARGQPGGHLAADGAEQPQIDPRQQAHLPDPVGHQGRGRRGLRPEVRAAGLSDRALQETSRTTCRASTTIQPGPCRCPPAMSSDRTARSSMPRSTRTTPAGPSPRI